MVGSLCGDTFLLLSTSHMVSYGINYVILCDASIILIYTDLYLAIGLLLFSSLSTFLKRKMLQLFRFTFLYTASG